jgi:hypothetical protein
MRLKTPNIHSFQFQSIEGNNLAQKQFEQTNQLHRKVIIFAQHSLAIKQYKHTSPVKTIYQFDLLFTLNSLKMISQQTFIVSTLLLALFNGSQAFSCNTKSVHRIETSLNAESTALNYRQGNDSNYAPSTLLYASSGSIQGAFNSEDDIERQIEEALNNARDADRKFGLCTQPSIRAWKIVDELYMRSEASRRVEDSVKSVLGNERSIWSLHE